MKYGLVLGGGGVRGAYQIGVWKALKEIGIEISAVSGTSIGALNSALIAQGEYDIAYKLWKEISIEKVVSIPDNIRYDNNLFKAKNLKKIAAQICRNGGLDMLPLEKMLKSLIDEDKIRHSSIELGITAFSLTDKKEIYKFISDIPYGKLVDYLMASVCMMGFAVREVGEQRLIDGGMANNMPVNMMLDRDIDNIITVDVRGIGTYRNFDLTGRNIINIRCESPQGGIMEFDRDCIENSIMEGYIGCMKAFGCLEGERYSFAIEDYRKARCVYSTEIISGIEYAADIFDVDRLKIYTFNDLVSITEKEYYKCAKRNEYGLNESIPYKIKNFDDNICLVWLIKRLKSGKSDFFIEKIPYSNKICSAASAVLYFLNSKNGAEYCISSKKNI